MMGKVTEICRIETVTPEIHAKPRSRNLQTTPSKQLSTQSDISAYTTSSTAVNTNMKSLTHDTEIHVNTDSDKESPSVLGVTLTHQHFVLVADRPNSTIKAIDLRKQTLISELKLEDEPWSLAKINEDKVAIGTMSGIQILCISKSGLLSKTEGKIPTKLCFGVVYSSGNFIVAASSCVEILNMNGKVLRTIKTDSDGGQLFTNCFEIAISKDHNTIYVSDCSKESVTSLTLDGHIKAIYKDKDLKGPWGITVDDENNVYVSSSGNNCIHRLSPECKKIQIFQDVKAICVFHTNNKLFVGHEKSIRIYDIK
jgi:DNA-binding beta-propeller fold protein YncE